MSFGAMFDYEREQALRRLLSDYVRSPSLRHLRDPHSLELLVASILKEVDRQPSVWRKWESAREELVRAAACCWIPEEDLRLYLNGIPGPHLTLTDVKQRLRAIHEEPYSRYPNEAVRAGCRALYEQEKADGTEFPAIVGAVQEFVESEEQRLREEHEAAWRQRRDEERKALQERFLSGADCKWTPIDRSKELYIRKNGRAYRLAPANDKRWHLFRIEAVEDPGHMIGTYGSRGDANKVLAKLAYEPEPRWS